MYDRIEQKNGIERNKKRKQLDQQLAEEEKRIDEAYEGKADAVSLMDKQRKQEEARTRHFMKVQGVDDGMD